LSCFCGKAENQYRGKLSPKAGVFEVHAQKQAKRNKNRAVIDYLSQIAAFIYERERDQVNASGLMLEYYGQIKR
jgi:hypothetical protein